MNKGILKRILLLLLLAVFAAAWARPASAATAVDVEDEEDYDDDDYDGEDESTDDGKKYFYSGGTPIAVYTDENTVEYTPVSDSNLNFKRLNALLAYNGKLTIKITPGSVFQIWGALRPTSNKTIIATDCTITMKPKTYVMMTDPTKNIHDLTVIGGKWRSPDKGGRQGSMFQLAFARNVLLDGIDVQANFSGHSIEIIACTNVTVQNCKVMAVGTCPSGCQEEQIQIDLSTPKTAPKVANFGKKYVKGQTCKNIKILNNTVYGARTVSCNYTSSEKNKYASKYHRNITIKGNKIQATTSEAIMFFNVIGGEISDNIVRTDSTRKKANRSYTIGIHIQNNGKAPSAMKKSKIVVKNNIVYGNRNGIFVKGYFKGKKATGKFGTVTITGNTVYCKDGKKSAIGQVKNSCRKFKVSNNTLKKWTKSVVPVINLK